MTMRRRPRRPVAARGQGGFTLIEVLMSLAILALMMTIAWSTTSSSSQAKKFFETYEQRNHEIRIALARIAEDISMAYLSENNQQGSIQEPRTAFIGKSGGAVAELRFSSFANRSLWADANESDQTMILYYADTDREDRSKTNLLRRASRRLTNEGWKEVPGEVDVLLRDIQKVEFEFYDWQDHEWKDRWDTTGADAQKGRLPERVKVTVTVKTPKGEEVKYVSQTRIMMQEELRFFTN